MKARQYYLVVWGVINSIISEQNSISEWKEMVLVGFCREMCERVQEMWGKWIQHIKRLTYISIPIDLTNLLPTLSEDVYHMHNLQYHIPSYQKHNNYALVDPVFCVCTMFFFLWEHSFKVCTVHDYEEMKLLMFTLALVLFEVVCDNKDTTEESIVRQRKSIIYTLKRINSKFA